MRSKRCDKAVRENFYQLHKKGLLYRANRLVNWCVKLNTTLSNLEVSPRSYCDLRKGTDADYITERLVILVL